MYKSIAVFCGSKSGNNPLFIEHTIELGKWMAANGKTLIYGGGSTGIMGTIADSVMENGGKVIGVMPDVLLKWEVGHKNITELHTVPNMHVRKSLMYELFEIITWNSLKIHSKKIILLNTAGYYNHLLAHLEYSQQQGFLHGDWWKKLLVKDTPQDIFTFFSQDTNQSHHEG